VHGAQIKSKVLAECRQPGASVAAVALAHGLNANLVRNWLHGRGVQRAGLKVDDAPGASRPDVAQASMLQFVPISMPVPGSPIEVATAPQAPAVLALPVGADVIEVELRRGANQVTVRWPATQAAQCTQWLRELSAAVLGADGRAP
jgi:Transposase.